jgi:hypothetical protein
MINEKDILAMLQNGEKADDIAQKLVDVLNKGKDLYSEELAAKAKADEEAKAKAAAEVEKQEDMADILDKIYQFVFKWYCDDDDDVAELDKAFASFTAKDAIKYVEEAGAMALQMTKMFDTLNFKQVPCKKAKPAVFEFTIEDKKDADHIINSFLKSIGL